MKKQDVILINYTGRRGGGPAVAYGMAKALKEKGKCVVAVLSEGIENRDIWPTANLDRIIFIPTYDSAKSFVINSLRFPFSQKQMIEEGLADYYITNIFCPMGAFWSVRINKLFPDAQTVLAIHDPIPHSGDKFKTMLLPDDAKRFDKLVVHTRKFVDYVEKKYGKPTYYFPLGRHDFYKTCQNKRVLLTYPSNKINFLAFGRITPYKGLHELAAAYKVVSSQLSGKVTLSIVGNGDFSPYKDEFSELPDVRVYNQWIADEEVESVFVGQGIISVCPYTDATQSGVLMVAMDYGVPVIATDVGGLSEQIQDGETGLLVESANVKRFADAMIRLATDQQLYAHIVEQEKIEIREHDWDKAADSLLKIFAD